MSTSLRVAPKLAPFFRSLNSEPREHHPYAQMFREDIVTGIIPIGGRSRNRPDFAIEIEGAEDNIKIAKMLIGSFSDRGSHNLKESFCCAIEEIARSISWEVTSKFEVVIDGHAAVSHHVSSRRTYRLPFYTVQFVPIEEREVWKRRILYCNNKYIWSITIPKSLGGAGGFKKTIKRLEKIPPGSMPDFVVQDLNRSINSSGFDFGVYSAQQIIYINKATLKWGWHRRDWSDDKQCEYYRAYKRAMFKYSQSLLREHITAELNKLLSRLRINCSITVKGLTSSSDIISAVGKLTTGEIKFTEIYDLIFD
ncbi:hypothetical protein [Pseudomonas putida]|uniref:hypothetical protein n=1 Tax=Pseudomonas putida TaxID=303 RepID=UPI003D990821